MSVFRFLSPHRNSRPSSPSPSSSRSKSKSKDFKIRLEFRVPSYGSVFMTPDQHDFSADHNGGIIDGNGAGPSGSNHQPRMDRESRGELEINIPYGMGKRRIKGIRVGMRTEVELMMGGERGWEKDVIFDRKVEIRGGSSEGIILEEGTQRFDFTLIVPANLCGHDRHPNGSVQHVLYAEVEGLPDPNASSSINARTSSKLKSKSTSPSRISSPRSSSLSPAGGSASGSATPNTAASSAVNPVSLASALSNMSIIRQDTTLPPVPPYEGHAEEVDWLVGNLHKERYMEILWNCHPEGGVTELDVLLRDSVAGLGPFELKLTSDCWTIGGLLLGTLRLHAPSPAVSIFSFRVSLVQTHTIQSPRDDPQATKPLSTTQSWPIFTVGNRPTVHDKRPGNLYSSIWKGKEAGGNQDGEVVLEGKGRNPHDNAARPTSIPNVPTPINVTHKLAIEVLFSVWGEDEQGIKFDKPGPGAVRALVVQKATTVASCAFTPEELRLPTYGTLLHQDAFSHLARKCPLCGKDPPDKLCLTCPPTSIPHPRHDHPPKLVGNDAGICPLCAEEVIPRRAPNWQDCACGMDTDYLEARMRKGQLPPGERRMEDEEVMVRKVDSERGRRR